MGASTVNVCHLLRSGTLLLLVILNLNASYPLEEGSTCDLKHSLVANTGTCVVVAHCPPAIKSVKTRRQHDLARCGFRGIFEVVCCPTDEIITDDDDDRKERTSTTTTTAEPTLNSTNKAKVRWPETRPSVKACADISDLFNETKVSFQISNGVDAEVGEFPHMVALYYDGDDDDNRYRCGGTLISDRFVLTAAHCIVRPDKTKPVACRMGSIDTHGKDGVDVPVRNITLHEEYQIRKKKNDIAIIELENSVNFTNTLHPACLYSRADDPIGLVITGWGMLGAANQTSRILQKGLVNPVKVSDCNATYTRNPSSKYSIEHNQLCAISEEKVDACQGDSGGPIQVVGPSSSVYYVIGITSFGQACGGLSPGVYTRVYSYLDWIERIVWPK